MNELKGRLSDILCKQIEVLAEKSQKSKPKQLCIINREIRKTIELLAAVKR